MVETKIKKDSYQNALFVFCDKSMNRLKVLHFDEGFWLYYHRLDKGRFKWLQNKDEALKINKIEPLLKDKEALERSRAFIGFNYCEQIYELESEIKEKYKESEDFYDKRYKIRLEKLKPLLDEFNSFVNEEIENALSKTPFGKALEYTKNLLPNMYFILEDGHLEIDNNAAERAIKPFVIGRKNWLFSKNPKGAHASATIYSIIETAKANNLIAERYLVYLFDKMTGIDDFTKFDFEPLMPWSSEIPNNIKKK